MNPARAPRDRRSDARLLVVDPTTATWTDGRAEELPSLLRAGDLLVVNDAATLPASLRGHGPTGEQLELRLVGPTQSQPEHWQVVLFGAGDWRTATEDRPAPAALTAGDRVELGPALGATVVAVSSVSPRLVTVEFDRRGAALWAALYEKGRPIQYSYLRDELALWSVQTVYGARPWAAEMPSAGRPLSWEILLALRRRGVELCWLTHAAGLSSTGDPALDQALPLAERYELPDTTVAAIARARRRGGRIIAVGTTVVRALEGAERKARAGGAAPGTLHAGGGWTGLVLDEQTRLAVVDGLLTGMHGPGESHFKLLSAFAPPSLLKAAWERAGELGYLCHEFGDLCLVQPAGRVGEGRVV